MASLIRISKPLPISRIPIYNKRIRNPSSVAYSVRNPIPNSAMVLGQNSAIGNTGARDFTRLRMKPMAMAPTAVESEMEERGFVEEMRAVAMRLHTRDQAKEGEKPVTAPEETSPAKWEPTVDGYLRFLVDSKLVYETLERIVEEAPVLYYAEFRNTGLERAESLARDLEWFKEQGFAVPEVSAPGQTYAGYLEELSVRDPQAFMCHFYNFYFAHSAGGQMIGNKVAQKILNNKELDFYKWDGNLRQLLQNVRDKLNKVAKSWSREEKNHCLEETEKSFVYSGEILRLILT